MKTLWTIVVGAAAGLALLGSPSTALAQNALGDGRALDANLRVGSGGRNVHSPRLISEIARRNALITGNTTSYAYFRGDPGITSPFAFRGDLGSDDIFRFQANTAFAQERLRALQTANLNRPYTLPRGYSGFDVALQAPGSGANASQLVVPGPMAQRATDPFATIDGVVRLPSEQAARRELEPGLLAAPLRVDGAEQVRSARLVSQAFGVTDVPLDALARLRADAADTRRIERFAADAPGTTPRVDRAESEADGLPDARITNRVDIGPSDPERQRVEDTVEPRVYVLTALAERAAAIGTAIDAPAVDTDASDPASVAAPDTQQAAVPLSEQVAAALAEQDSAERAEAMKSLRDRLSERFREMLSQEYDEDGNLIEQREPVVEGGVVEMLREPLEVRRLAPAVGLDTLFAAHMVHGERFLAEGRWFAAEERFLSALRIEPDDMFAKAGRVHAQLGAGLFLSSSQNLLELMSTHPEVLAIRFDAVLLPGQERQASLIEQLRERIGREDAFSARAGLLLAYMGRQQGDNTLIAEGLDAMDLMAVMGVAPEPMIGLAGRLRTVWLHDDDAPTAQP